MTITSTELIERFPSLFLGEDTNQVDLMLAEGYLELPAESWTNDVLRDKAVKFLVAHKKRLERGDDLKQGAVIKSIAENASFNIDYFDETNHKSKSYYRQTIYGREFLRIKKKMFGGGIFVV